jgi:N-acetylmuramoyl-L-alanine amidase
MITTSQKPGHQYLRKLLVLPVAAVVAALFAFSYKKMKAENDTVIRSKEPITIVIDAGHGGIDPGAKSVDGKYTEAELALEISKLIQELSQDFNINVVMTREDDKLPGAAITIPEGLNKRVEIVNQVNPKAYVSIHLNSVGKTGKGTDQTGFAFYISSKDKNNVSSILGTHVIKELEKIYPTFKTVQLTTNREFFIFDSLKIPALVVECGFINNSKDLAFITDKTNHEKIARAILSGVSKFANQTKLKEGINKIIKEEIELNKKETKPATDTPKIKTLEVTLVDTAPLLVVDGKIYGRINTKKIDKELSPYDIESISVYKSPKSVVKYGEQGKYGVIEVFTKKYIVAHPDIKAQREALHDSLNKNNNLPLQEVVVVGHKTIPNSDNLVFEKVETPPSFPGGIEGWRKYLEKNLDASIPVKNGVKPGTYTISVRFVVTKNGDITSLNAMTKFGHGMEEEVIRVISKGPKWNPGSQNGKVVNAYHTQPVTFVVTDEKEDAKKNNRSFISRWSSSLERIFKQEFEKNFAGYSNRIIHSFGSIYN